MAELALGCSGVSGVLARRVDECLAAAADALGLTEDFRAIEICADDFTGQDHVWFHVAAAEPAGDARAAITVYCPAEVFCRPVAGAAGLFPGVEVWEQFPVGRVEAGLDPGEFSSVDTERFLYHNLLLARDLIGGAVDREDLPPAYVQAFGAAWAVTIDGRLSRAGLPGYDLAHRRGRFSGLFSSAGVLLPGHWEIFQALWDGAFSGDREVLGAVKQLPRL